MNDLSQRARAAAAARREEIHLAAQGKMEDAERDRERQAAENAANLNLQAHVAMPVILEWFKLMGIDSTTTTVRPLEALPYREVTISTNPYTDRLVSKFVPPTTVFEWEIDGIVFRGYVNHPIDGSPPMGDVRARIKDRNSEQWISVPTLEALGEVLLNLKSR